jgi:hypothetical protein
MVLAALRAKPAECIPEPSPQLSSEIAKKYEQ